MENVESLWMLPMQSHFWTRRRATTMLAAILVLRLMFVFETCQALTSTQEISVTSQIMPGLLANAPAESLLRRPFHRQRHRIHWRRQPRLRSIYRCPSVARKAVVRAVVARRVACCKCLFDTYTKSPGWQSKNFQRQYLQTVSSVKLETTLQVEVSWLLVYHFYLKGNAVTLICQIGWSGHELIASFIGTIHSIHAESSEVLKWFQSSSEIEHGCKVNIIGPC